MVLKLNERYPGRFANPSAGYPQGAFRNRSAPNAQDGSYLEQDWANDILGMLGRFMTVANISANGQVDDATSSQYYNAIIAAVKSNLGTAALRNVGNNDGQVPDYASFSTGGLNAFRLPTGHIVQFDSGVVTNGGFTKTYQVPFPNRTLLLIGTMYNTTGLRWVATPNAFDRTAANINFVDPTTGNAWSGQTVGYIAIGY